MLTLIIAKAARPGRRNDAPYLVFLALLIDLTVTLTLASTFTLAAGLAYITLTLIALIADTLIAQRRTGRKDTP